MTGVQHRPVAADEADIRLDRWFRRHFPALKHGRLEKLLRTGQIRVDGSRARASTRLEAGQDIRIPPLDEAAKKTDAPAPQKVSAKDRDWINAMVIHADDHVIALNKPPGVAVQGGSKIGRHIDGLLGALVGRRDDRPKLVHRLDRDTSGVLLVARSASDAAALGEAFRSRETEKIYWALVAGVPKPRAGRIDVALLKRDGPDGNEKVVADPAMGKAAVTGYETVETAGRRAAWLRLRPETGRTHQLRVHCAGLGTPIVGDGKYGGTASRIDGLPGTDKLHLHARAIALPHPAGGTLRITAPLSPAMAETWRFLGFDPDRKD